MSGSPDGVYEPGIVDPGVPVDHATAPYWLSEPAAFADAQTPWVSDADIVVIGSGITAASILQSVFEGWPDARIVLVEARSLCSGATGRNGGHIKVMSYNVWGERKKRYGVIEAVRWTNFEHSHLPAMAACVEREGLQCDLQLQEGVDAYYDPDTLRSAVRALEDMRRFAPEAAAEYTVYSAEQTRLRFGCAENCVGGIGVPAAAVWPYKMVTGLIENMLGRHQLSIQAHTKVVSVDDQDRLDYATVHTSRGSIRAAHVIHATNAWLGHLVPEIRPYISPVRGNVVRQTFPDHRQPLSNTFWLRYGEKDYDYLIPRPEASLIIGRANLGRRATGDDSATDLLPQAHLDAILPQVLQLGGEQPRTTHRWSGILGFTQDGNPFVGRLPTKGRSHQWVCGGYHGIGMIKAFQCGRALAGMVLGKGVPDTFPRSALVDDGRMRWLRASLKVSKI